MVGSLQLTKAVFGGPLCSLALADVEMGDLHPLSLKHQLYP